MPRCPLHYVRVRVQCMHVVLYACLCTCVRARAACAQARGASALITHELTRESVRQLTLRLCDRAADAKLQCEAQMKYRIQRKEMLQPHQAILPRMPVMPTVRGTNNQPVDVL